MENQKNARSGSRKILWGVIALIAAAAVLLGIYFAFAPKGSAGEKTITVDVVMLDGSETTTTITTGEEYLRGGLEQENIIAGDESKYGLFVTTANGVTADDSKEQWWCFTKGGESLATGVDSTPIADGDAFEITLTEGY